ncbi:MULTISPECIES: cysteine--tRNA ligase [unclassified Oceanispirochaeta]|uniref:cysteine--tRNA ligase n=1 Tax=unclassified Oceanispirochaeta TaxID=2635722 RepID=UPI000E09B2E5|nr:cysteine--tRNA ligase [Oceanispirochaeta sp. M1]MBF9015900.1 cysteine--tRNA ligase [Oceanispirochaeta sp. M2]NPD72363.1 cysteine--tRNA ligase [Oceanispirochaeta sp. M1]RDG32134.1 cysteine--tRNA ligase [Oceanispirochaeta sp. M1]
MKMKLLNSDGRQLEDFVPLKEGEVSLYCCGPTVYNYAHIGNMRAYTYEDILKRTMEYAGYRVNHVMNVTDVGHLTGDGDDGEDKMIKSAREQGMTVWDIAKHFTDAFFNDSERLNIIRPNQVCKATEHIQEMIDMVKTLEDKGFTYVSGGNVYFDTSKYPEYGRMANLENQDLQHGARVEVDTNKRNYTDFVLWFTNSKFGDQVMTWDSPWGTGYPGWHIECSAMSTKYLGPHFDIHCGGVDHIPIHHTNEIAQSEAANGCKWVNYWLHNEFILMKSGKMSKSKGGFITLQDLVDKGYDPLDYRYFLLGGHYRSQLVFSWESLDASRSARESLMRKIAVMKKEGEAADVSVLSEAGQKVLNDFQDHMAADLNTPRALADIWSLLKNKELSSTDKLTLIMDMDRILGLKLDEENTEESGTLDASIDALIAERQEARKNKDFARSDEIRDQLLEQGIQILDSPDGPKWKKN